MLKIETIINVVSNYTGIAISEMHRNTRKREIVEARQLSMYFLCSRSTATLKTVGKHLNKDHSTVIHGRDTIKDLLTYDKVIQKKVSEINSELDMETLRLGLNLSNECPCCKRPLN